MTTKAIKSIILSFLTLCSCLLFWYFLHSLFYKPALTFTSIVWTSLLFFIFIVLLNLVCFLVDLKTVVYPLLILSTLSFFLFFDFSSKNRFGYFFGLVLLLFALFWGYRNINSEKGARIRPSLYQSTKIGLPFILTFFILVICLAYYFTPVIQAQVEKIQIPRKMFDVAVASSEKIISGFIPGFKKDITVDEFSFLMVLTALEKQEEFELPPEIIKLLKEENVDVSSRDKVFRALRENPKIREKFMEMLSVYSGPEKRRIQEMFKEANEEIRGDELFLDVLYKIANNRLNDIVGHYRKYIPLAASIGLFFILRILMVPFEWLVLLFSWIIFILLKLIGVVRIEKVQKEIETVTL